MYKCFSLKDRLHVPRWRGGHGLQSVEDVLHHERLSLAKYLTGKEEPLLQVVHQEPQWSSLQESPSKFKDRASNEHFEARRNKPLHGPFIRELNDGVDLKQQWSVVT